MDLQFVFESSLRMLLPLYHQEFCDHMLKPNTYINHYWGTNQSFYIIGLATIWSPLTTGLLIIECIPKIADWGGLIIGVPNREPKTPPLIIIIFKGNWLGICYHLK